MYSKFYYILDIVDNVTRSLFLLYYYYCILDLWMTCYRESGALSSLKECGVLLWQAVKLLVDHPDSAGAWFC